MTNEKFNNIVNESIEQLEVQQDYSTNIMTRIKENNIKPIRFFVKRYLIIAAILVAFSTTVYAGVVTYQLIELKNDEDEVIATVEVIDTNENVHLDTHVSMEELFRYGDSLHSDPKWEGKSFVVIDTLATYPMNMDLRPKSEHLFDYDEVSNEEVLKLLPRTIGRFSFNGLSYGYGAEFPDKELVEQLIKDNADERFIVSEIESQSIEWLSYNYMNEEDDLMMSVWLSLDETEKEFSVTTGTLEDYEVVRLSDIEVFLIEPNYKGVTYEEERTIKTIGENYFEALWFEVDKDLKVKIDPRVMLSFDKNEQVVDGETVYLEVYPDNTRELVLEFSEMVHEIISR